MRLIVFVKSGQRLVELDSEALKVRRRIGELDQKAVTAGTGRVLRKDGADVKINNGGGACLSRGGDGFFDLLTDKMLPERRQEVFRPAREAQKRRVAFFEADGIPQQVAPKAGAARHHDGILDSQLDLSGRVPRRSILA